MPLINPVIEGLVPTIPIIEERLREALPDLVRRDHYLAILDNKGASVENAATQLGNLLNYSDNEHMRMRAVETVLKAHKVMDSEGNKDMSINFVFHEAVNFAQILQPREERAA